MRTIAVAIFLILYSIFTIPMVAIEWIVGKISPEKHHIIAQKCVVKGFKIILHICGVKLTVKGKENIPKNQAALFAYNHRSYFDILVGYVTAPMRTSFVSKYEMLKVPMISWWMKCMNCLFLDREDIKQGMKTILDGIELLKKGTSIYIAPEGTRSKNDEVHKFHEASFKLADKSKTPIVPVCINNTDALLEKHEPWIHSGHVIIEYCEPIYMSDMDRDEKKHIGEKVRAIISEKYKKNAKEI